MAEPNPRLDYLANLKAALTALVILHHTAIAYGGAGQLIYRAPSHPPESNPALVAFNAVNQTFFMALFFFIAGFFSRRSLARRVDRDGTAGAGRFVGDKMWRLGLPSAVYSLLGPPFCALVVAVGRGGDADWEGAWSSVTGIRGVRGPVWFCALLLMFDCLLAGLYWLKETRLPDLAFAGASVALPEDGAASTPSTAGMMLLASLTLLSVVDFLWRLCFPVGFIFTFLNLNMGYLPQYVAAYAFGVAVTAPEDAVGRPRSMYCLGAISMAGGVLLITSMSSRLGDARDPALGGLNALAAVYAVWNNAMGYLIAAGLLRLVHTHVSSSWKATTDLAYTAFLLHIPVSTLVEVALEWMDLGPVTMTVVVGSINVLASWAAARMWERAGSAIKERTITAQAATVQRQALGSRAPNRRRESSTGERTIEILEGLDEVGR